MLMESAAMIFTDIRKQFRQSEDAYFQEGAWCGVSDGVGGWYKRGIDAGDYARELMSHCKELAATNDPQAQMPKDLLSKAASRAVSPGTATAIVGKLDGNVLHIANVGDSGVVLLTKDYHVYWKSDAMQRAFNQPFQLGTGGDDAADVAETFSVTVTEGDIFVFATDGLFDNLYLEDIVKILRQDLSQGLSLEAAARILVHEAHEAAASKVNDTPFAETARQRVPSFKGGKLDDITVILGRFC